MARLLGIDEAQFLERYTHETVVGRSLTERRGPHGYDCVFLDRTRVPGKALCQVYQARPMQCRTWPFWPENLQSRKAWDQAAQKCPGMNTGPLHTPAFIRVTIEQMLDWEK